jgi:hypothetical protein
MQRHDAFKDMDYLLPTITKDGLGFIPRPCAYERALTWLRDVLARLGAPAEEIQKVTWHSFRLFSPDHAFQAMISKEQRQFLGNWSSESMPGIYTREKRHVVCNIWKKIAQSMPNHTQERQVREDTDHPDWDDPAASPIISLGDSVPVSSSEVLPIQDDEDRNHNQVRPIHGPSTEGTTCYWGTFNPNKRMPHSSLVLTTRQVCGLRVAWARQVHDYQP